MTCSYCNSTKHTVTQCDRVPCAPHVVEPYDGTEAMVKCADCRGSERNGAQGVYRCPRSVPSMKRQPQHCDRFRGRA